MTKAEIWRAHCYHQLRMPSTLSLPWLIASFANECRRIGQPLANPHIEEITLTTADLPHGYTPAIAFTNNPHTLEEHGYIISPKGSHWLTSIPQRPRYD